MPEATLSQEIFNLLQARYDLYFVQIYGALMDSFKYSFRLLVAVYLILTGYKMAMNKGEESYLDIAKTCLISCTVYYCVLESDIYSEWVVEPIMGVVTDLAAFFTQQSSARLFEALDNQAMDFLAATSSIFSWSWNPADYIFQFVAFLILNFVFFAMFFSFLVIYCISYFSMCIFFLVGGVFILFGTIPKTRGLFFAWLRNLSQFGLTIIFSSIALGLCFKGITESVARVQHLDTTHFWTLDFFSLIGWCLITIALFLKSPDFAAGLTSTMAGSTAGIAGAMSAGAGATAAGTLAGGKMAGAGALGAAKWGADKSGLTGYTGSATQALKAKLGIKD